MRKYFEGKQQQLAVIIEQELLEHEKRAEALPEPPREIVLTDHVMNVLLSNRRNEQYTFPVIVNNDLFTDLEADITEQCLVNPVDNGDVAIIISDSVYQLVLKDPEDALFLAIVMHELAPFLAGQRSPEYDKFAITEQFLQVDKMLDRESLEYAKQHHLKLSQFMIAGQVFPWQIEVDRLIVDCIGLNPLKLLLATKLATERSLVVTLELKNRLESLAEIYGCDNRPALDPDYHITITPANSQQH